MIINVQANNIELIPENVAETHYLEHVENQFITHKVKHTTLRQWAIQHITIHFDKDIK